MLITETHHGFVCANAGVTRRTCRRVTVLPRDPDGSAERLRGAVRRVSVSIGVIVAVTFGRPGVGASSTWRLASPACGLIDYRGSRDPYGRRRSTVVASPTNRGRPEIDAQDRAPPVAIVRGAAEWAGRNAQALVREAPFIQIALIFFYGQAALKLSAGRGALTLAIFALILRRVPFPPSPPRCTTRITACFSR